jgi:hypothetical protein
MIFECEEVETRGPYGELLALGVQWSEARVVSEKVYDWMARMVLGIAIVAGGLAVLGGLVAGAKVFVPLAAIAGAGLGLTYLFAWFEVHTPGKPRTILFGRDGVVTSSQDGTWRTRVGDIRTIGAEQLRQRKEGELAYTHGVQIVTRRGRVLHVAKDLTPDDAATLAVMLSEAIEAVKFADQVQVSSDMAEAAVW